MNYPYVIEVTLKDGSSKRYGIPVGANTYELLRHKKELSEEFDVSLDDVIVYADGGAIL